MSSNLSLTKIPNIETLGTEIVERKGIGHPDTLADGIAESISNDFSIFCLTEYGAVLNHWLDKTLITGALGEMDYGYGVLKSPILVYLFGKMSQSFGGKSIDIETIASKSTRKFLSHAVPLLDVKKDLKVNFTHNSFSKNPFWMNPRDLEDLPNRIAPRANDSSIGVGYWPLTKVENLALNIERFFYNKTKPKYSFIGQDIKVLISRSRKNLDITLCVPFIAKFTPNEEFYLHHRDKLQSELSEFAQNFMGIDYTVNLVVNNADSLNQSERLTRKGYYFLVTGTALDDGEVGVVGRGNPSSGVISSMRTHSMEAPYGKNPVHHVGKVYTYIANKLAKQISEKYDAQITIILTSKMGNLLSEPANIIVESDKSIPKSIIKASIFEELRKGIWAEEIINSQFFLPSPGNIIRHG